MNKDQVSSSYIETTKTHHANKPLATKRRAIVVGADFDETKFRTNIGAAIAKAIPFSLTSQLDVNSPYDEFGKGADVLILANGYTSLNWFEDQEDHEIEKMFNVNVVGSLKTARRFVTNTINASYKKYIVFIGSMAYCNVLNGSLPYCAAKAALAHAAKCMAWELAPKGYNVFCVHPSNTEGTPMTEQTIIDLMRYRGLTREEAENYWGAVLPKAQWLQPEEIADTVSFLISGKADYLSGSNIHMAGGQR